MRRDLEAKLNMYKATDQFLNLPSSLTITAGIPTIATYVDQLETYLDSIRTTSESAENPITGITEDKAAQRLKVSVTGNNIAGAVHAYAVDTNNLILKAQMKYRPSDFLAYKDDELPSILYNIWSTANAIATVTPPATNPLIPYGVTTAILTAFKTAIDSYSESVAAPRGAIAGRSADNVQLLGLFNTVDLFLTNQLDRVVYQLQPENPDFYQEYLNNRKIVGPTRRYTQVSGIITDANGDALANVLVTAIGKDYVRVTKTGPKTIPGKIYQVTSDANGNYAVKTAAFQTTYTLKYSLTGFADVQEADIKVSKGDITPQDVTMVTGA
jgi:hypothetical protein